MITPYLESLIRQGKAASKQFSKTINLGLADLQGTGGNPKNIDASIFEILNTGNTIIIHSFTINSLARAVTSAPTNIEYFLGVNLKINAETLNSYNYVANYKHTRSTDFAKSESKNYLLKTEDCYIVAKPDTNIKFCLQVKHVEVDLSDLYGAIVVQNIDVNNENYKFPNKMGVKTINPILHQVQQLHDVVPETNNIFQTPNQRTFSAILDGVNILGAGANGVYVIQGNNMVANAINIQYVEIFGAKTASSINF